MKKFKKLIPAFCMLLVSAVMLGTSTFAWFSMNTQVKATGLNVNAKSNAAYLLINNEDKSGLLATSLTATAAAKKVSANSDVYPVTYIASVSDTSKIGEVTIKDKADNWTEWQTKHWFTATNGNSGSAKDDVQTITPIDIATATDYRLEYNVWLTLSKDSENISKKVKVTADSSSDDSVKAFVKIEGDSADLAVGHSGNATTAATVSLSATTAVKVTIYVYIDGEEENVNSDYFNASGITGNLSLMFDLVD